MGHSQVTAANRTVGEIKTMKVNPVPSSPFQLPKHFYITFGIVMGAVTVMLQADFSYREYILKHFLSQSRRNAVPAQYLNSLHLPNPTCSRSSAPGSTVFAAWTFPIPRKYHENSNIERIVKV